jgi:ATP-dependent DNA ligase
MSWSNARPRQRSEQAPAEFIDPCLPTKVDKPPIGDDWAHEIKFDGYRLQIHVGCGDVRLYTVSGYDWTERYPLIAAAATKLKSSMIVDAEAVIQGQMASPTLKRCTIAGASPTRSPTCST